MESNEVQDYYNRLTRAFLRVGGATRRTGSLHRSLRLPRGTRTVPPITAVDALILEAFRRNGVLTADRQAEERPPLIGDLGCGVGASMAWMQGETDARFAGITLSPVQADEAGRRLRPGTAVCAGRYDDPDDLRRMTNGESLDGAYMIESFVHAENPPAVFEALADRMRPGGLLVICDDLPSERLLQAIESSTPAEGPFEHGRSIALASEFRTGWHINAFLSPERLLSAARPHGWNLVEELDLSPFVMRYRPRDLVARMGRFAALALRLTGRWWENVRGGSALQRLIHRRAVRYRLLVLRLEP